MKTRYQLLLVLFALGLAGGLIYTASHYHSLYKDEQKRADDATERADATEAVTANVIQAVRVMNSISRANQDAKNQIALDAQRAKDDIKMAVAGDTCTNRLVPASAVKRLHDYAESLRTCSSSTNTSQSHC